MKKQIIVASIALAFGLIHTATFAQSATSTVNVICSVQAEWCNLISTVYAKTTGVKINMSLKGSGEALAQIIAEREGRDGTASRHSYRSGLFLVLGSSFFVISRRCLEVGSALRADLAASGRDCVED